jgi:tetratricopeptide (TPR) repeat protein
VPYNAEDLAQTEIAIHDIVNAALEAPDLIADTSALVRHDRDGVPAGEFHVDLDRCWRVVDAITYRLSWFEVVLSMYSPAWHRENAVDFFNPEIYGHALRPLPEHGNSTLDFLLKSHCRQAVEESPTFLRSGAWLDLAERLLQNGDKAAAEAAVIQAEDDTLVSKSGYGKWATIARASRIWADLQNYDRALQAVDKITDSDERDYAIINLTKALLKSGLRKRALAVIRDLRLPEVPDMVEIWRLGRLLRFVDAFVDVGDVVRARAFAVEMQALVDQTQPKPEDNLSIKLAVAARAMNDVGDHASAINLLVKADERLSLKGTPSFVIESAEGEIAAERYRAGDISQFGERGSQSAFLSTSAWAALCAQPDRGGSVKPSPLACAEHVDADSLVAWADRAAIDGDGNLANCYLNGAFSWINEYLSGAKVNGPQWGAVSFLEEVAFVATNAANSSLTDRALMAAAKVADNSTDRDQRAAELAVVAVFRKELLN